MAEAKKSTKKIIDVQHPDKSAPSGNSKSVIVTNRPIIKDPMVVEEENKSEEVSTSVAVSASSSSRKTAGEPVIKPLSDQAKDDAKNDDPADDSKEISGDKKADKTIEELALEAANKKQKTDNDNPKVETGTEEADKTDKAEKIEETKTNATSTAEKADIVENEDTEEADKADKKLQDEAEDKEAKKRQQAVARLVESKKYYLPINTVEKRRSKRVVILGVTLSVVLLLGWINIALDAGLIELGGIKALTDFF